MEIISDRSLTKDAVNMDFPSLLLLWILFFKKMGFHMLERCINGRSCHYELDSYPQGYIRRLYYSSTRIIWWHGSYLLAYAVVIESFWASVMFLLQLHCFTTPWFSLYKACIELESNIVSIGDKGSLVHARKLYDSAFKTHDQDLSLWQDYYLMETRVSFLLHSTSNYWKVTLCLMWIHHFYRIYNCYVIC